MSQQASDLIGAVPPVRRMSFEDALATVPKHFAAGGNLFVSHLWAHLSGVFPPGEAFFVRAVHRCCDRIADPALRERVAGFSGQEGMHARVHRLLNDRLAAHGYPSKTVERLVGRIVRVVERLLSPLSCLARTAALEHFTASLAERMLLDPAFQAEVGDPVVTELVLWHALEEAEHKAVAFDVYRAVGGSERQRIWTMRLVRYGFAFGTVIGTLLSVLGDPAAYRDGNLRRSWRAFRRSPFLSRALWAQLKEYERPGFHPDDHDTTALVATWRDRLFGDAGTLTSRLVRAAA